MTPDLPDDVNAWPSDPFLLLGLERGAAAIEIKRAYTRLIRKFKPEQFPEEFRRIREAYDACNSQAHWFFETKFDDTLAFRLESAPRSEPEPAVEKPIDEITRLWSLAGSGQMAEAYAGLARLADTDATRLDLPLRLYWLLSLDPDLDSWRTRLDWLLEALKRSRLGGAAAELYRRELAIDPEAALYGHFQSLLDLEAGANEKLAVARLRFAAAGRSQSWNVLVADVKALARSLPLVNEQAWLSYLVAMVDWCAWTRPMPLYGILSEEVKKLTHLQLPLAYFFDRMEEAERVTEGWINAATQALPEPWMRLVPMAWALGGGLSLDDVKAATVEAHLDPVRARLRFERVEQEVGPHVVAVLMRALDQVHYSTEYHEAEFSSDWIRALAVRLPGGWMRPYDTLRDDLLTFLLVHAIHPDEFAAACERDPERRLRDRAASLREDIPLKLTWLACTLGERCGS